jgi:hypothetical protein
MPYSDRDRLLIFLLLLILIALMLGAWQIGTYSTPKAPIVYRTISTQAYKLNVGYANRPFVEKFGTVALGIECRPSGANASSGNTVQMLLANDLAEYRVIDRAKVTPPENTASKPLVLYGRCAPESETEQCPPLPGPETQTAICPTGYAGTWQQTRTYTAAPAPECSEAGPWLPAAPPQGACTAAPEGSINLPVVCHDDSAEGEPINACMWSDQEFTLGTPEALVRACKAMPCSFEVSGWAKLNSLPPAQFVEVCGKLKEHPAPVSGGECGDASGTWSLMRYVPPSEVAGYSVPTHDYVWLEWTRPRVTEAGAELTDLAGYRIYYGTASGLYTQTVDINNPATLEYTFETLPHNTYFFVVRAFSTTGGESALSNEVSKAIK